VTLVAVTVDNNGVIEQCIIDSIGTAVEFNNKGVVTKVPATIATKNELGDSYGMINASSIKKEWYQQAAALADYAEGKTIDQLKNGEITNGKATEGSDLASSATIYLGGYVSAIEVAVNNAKHLGAMVGDELRLAAIPSASGTNATADKKGVAQLDVDVTALTVKDGVITSCYIDSLQAKVELDTTGAIKSDISGFKTKNELGESYGMVAWGGATFEWNVQAANFAAYVTGKTADEVAGIAVKEGTKPTDADLAAGVTIAIGGFQALIAKAMK
jgi:predicted ATPase